MAKTLITHRDDEAPRDEQDVFDRALVKKHCDQLIEHFTSVRIFITRHDPERDETKAFSRGRGDFYSQQAGIEEWVLQQRESTKRQVWQDDE